MGPLANNDASLLRQVTALIADRNEKALELLYDSYYDKLCYFAQTFVASPETAEELVEDIFIKLWTQPLLVANINNLSVYLYKAVRNACLDELDKKHATLSTDFSTGHYQVEDLSSSPLEELVLSEMNEALHVAIDGLPPRCRLIFTLIRQDGLSYKQVAEILGISINTIDNQMAIAIKRICAALGITRHTPANRPSRLS